MLPEEHEQQLRFHIQNLLFVYAKTHLTVDYIAWTEEAVSEVQKKRVLRVSGLMSC